MYFGHPHMLTGNDEKELQECEKWEIYPKEKNDEKSDVVGQSK